MTDTIEMSFDNTVYCRFTEYGKIPYGAKKVIFIDYCGSFVVSENGIMKSIIPETVKKVVIYGKKFFPLFYDNIRILPDGVKSFKFSVIDDVLLGEWPLEYILVDSNGVKGFPNGIETIEFSDQIISLEFTGEKTIPDSVKKLKLPYNFNSKLIDSNGTRLLPKNLKSLEFSGDYNQSLIIGGIRAFPETLKKIIMPRTYNYPLVENNISIFPENLETLDIQYCITHFAYVYNNALSNGITYFRALPKGLKYIFFPQNFNDPLVVSGIRILPDSIVFISFRQSSYNHPIVINNVLCFPDSVEHIIFGDAFDHPIMQNGYSLLPPNLVTVYFGSSFNQNIYDNNTCMSAIPNTIKNIAFGFMFDYKKLYHNNKSLLSNNIQSVIIRTIDNVLHPKYFSNCSDMCIIEQIGYHDIHKKIMITNHIFNILPMPIADEIYEHCDIYSPFGIYIS